MPDAAPQHTLQSNDTAFPALDERDLAALEPFGRECDYADGEQVLRSGEAEADMLVVKSGALRITNPIDDNRHVVTHTAGQFTGDIDLLTGRPIIVDGFAEGPTRVIRVPCKYLRRILTTVPVLSDKLINAFQERRYLLQKAGRAGLMVVGPGDCRDTNLVREFLHKNFVPFYYLDTADEAGQQALREWGSPTKSPVIGLGHDKKLVNPSLRDLAHAAGVWRGCPTSRVDLAIVGGGPAGITAAVYAASEGLSVVVLDKLGPGGQAGGSSKIENFIGFPAGLSGTELATRGVLQMLKFGASIVTPVNVDSIQLAEDNTQPHTLHLDCGNKVDARVVLVSTGVAWRKLEARGAGRYERSGVYYACTSVEAQLYDNRPVAVVGAGNSAGQAAMFLSECCPDRQVHMIVRGTLGPSMSDYLVQRIRNAANITVHEGVEIDETIGDQQIRQIKLKKRDGSPAGTIEACGVFVFIGAEPQAKWLGDVARDSLGYLLTGGDVASAGKWNLTDRPPCPLETSLPRVLAAGDIRAGSTKRVGFAVGDGALAVTCAHRLLSGIR